ncbi:hypothetical protein SLS63_013750 [Diaporthe eres]|uniref:Methyltransferase domain-containing protein n=1 Tax=Diaporthe eres TaxID=83184 RepID=A0ABR1NML3_DIAER
MAANNPNRRSLDLFNVDQQAVENLDLTFQETLPSSTSTYTEIPDTYSISESVLAYRVENGRTYHAYKDGWYLLPNDAEEVERLRLTHDIVRRVMGNRSHLAPWTRDHFPRRVLDVGTGTGDWCFDFAEEYPETELIIGTDLSNIQPDVGPPNVQFIIDDSSQEWLDDDLDYVHTRDTNGCWENMSAQVIQQAFQKLNPGGWLESQEFDIVLRCDDGTAPADHGLRLWLSELDRISRVAGKPCTITPWLKTWYEEAGFVDVHEEIFRLPTCGWPEDPEEKIIGTWMEEMLNSGIDGILRAYQLRVAGLTMEQHQIDTIFYVADFYSIDLFHSMSGDSSFYA